MNSTLKRLQTHLRIGVILLLTGMIMVLARPTIAIAGVSQLNGLMALNQMSQQAVPYEEAIANGKPTLLEFYADWCSSCQAMAPTLQTFHRQYGETVNFVMLNVDEPQWYPEIRRYQVTGVPHMLLLGSDQSVVRTLIGRVPGPVLSDAFQQLLNLN